jgi:pyridoxal phosphate enzyme (YggS family)
VVDGRGRPPGIENLYAVQTLTSTKVADALNKHRAAEHAPLRVLVQLNTSGEEVKGGIAAGADEEIVRLATHVIRACPRLRLVGLMTIGAPGGGENDFTVLREARDRLVRMLPDDGAWGDDEDADVEDGRERRLLLSMGMSADFELALRTGADIVRVGTSIFGARPSKKD